MGEAAKDIELTVEQYLEFEDKSPIRHEYINGYLRAMAGASEEHNVIVLNIGGALNKIAKQKGCRAFTSEMKLKINNNKFYYPDVMVTCSGEDKDRFFKQNPCFLVEVLSLGTESIDHKEKLENYLKIKSLECYVLIAQDTKMVKVFTRKVNSWDYKLIEDSGEIYISCLGHQLTLDEIYDGLNFD